MEKYIYLVKGNFEIAQEVETIFPEVGKVFTWLKVIFKGKNIYHRSCRFMLEEQTFLIREHKNRLMTRSHVFSQEEEAWSSFEVEKGIRLV